MMVEGNKPIRQANYVRLITIYKGGYRALQEDLLTSPSNAQKCFDSVSDLALPEKVEPFQVAMKLGKSITNSTDLPEIVQRLSDDWINYFGRLDPGLGVTRKEEVFKFFAEAAMLSFNGDKPIVNTERLSKKDQQELHTRLAMLNLFSAYYTKKEGGDRTALYRHSLGHASEHAEAIYVLLNDEDRKSAEEQFLWANLARNLSVEYFSSEGVYHDNDEYALGIMKRVATSAFQSIVLAQGSLDLGSELSSVKREFPANLEFFLEKNSTLQEVYSQVVNKLLSVDSEKYSKDIALLSLWRATAMQCLYLTCTDLVSPENIWDGVSEENLAIYDIGLFNVIKAVIDADRLTQGITISEIPHELEEMMHEWANQTAIHEYADLKILSGLLYRTEEEKEKCPYNLTMEYIQEQVSRYGKNVANLPTVKAFLRCQEASVKQLRKAALAKVEEAGYLPTRRDKNAFRSDIEIASRQLVQEREKRIKKTKKKKR